MNKSTYEPETLEEEFAFLAGRVAAMEAILNADDGFFVNKEIVAATLGISYIPLEKKKENHEK